MIHLFKHKDGKFDIALVVKGKFIVGSNQHYNRRLGALKAMATLKYFIDNITIIRFQDDTLIKQKVFQLDFENPKKFVVKETMEMPSKKYIPNKK